MPATFGDLPVYKMNKTSKNIRLHIPTFEELSYRQKILSDADTMRYNKGYDLEAPNYCKETGCIDFPKEAWARWYNTYIGQEPDRYYAYIVVDGVFVGEVNVYKDEKMNWYEMGIVIESVHRGKGYSRQALDLLLEQAFEKLGAEAVHNIFEETRTAAMKIHSSAGFCEYKRENGIVELLLTKKQYEAKRIKE